MARDRASSRTRVRAVAAALSSLALVAAGVAGAPQIDRALAVEPADPWTTIAIVSQTSGGDVVRHLRTGSVATSGGELLADVEVPGARKVVVGSEGTTLRVLTAPSDGNPAAIRTVTVQPDGDLLLEPDTIVVGGDARDVALSPDGRHVYTADGDAGTVSVVDLVTQSVHPITVGGHPSSLVIAPDGLRGVVVDAEGRVLLVDVVTGAVLAIRPVAAEPVGIALDDQAERVVIASRGAAHATGELASFAIDAMLSPLSTITLGEPSAPERPLAVVAARETGSLLVPLEGESEVARFAHLGSVLTAVAPLELPSEPSSVLVALPRYDQVDIALPTEGVIGRVAPPTAGLDHEYTTNGDVRALITLPGQPVAVSGPDDSVSLRGVPSTLSITATRAHEVAEYRWQVGHGTVLVTTEPHLQRTFPLEGGYAVEVEAITALGAGAEARFDGRTALSGGSPGASTRFIHEVIVVEKLGEQTFRSPLNPFASNDAHFWQVPNGTVQLIITAAGRAGGAGEESGGGFGDICDAFGDSCTNEGAEGGPRPVMRVQVPIGDSELVAPGEVLGIAVAGTLPVGHGQLLGGFGGSGGGTDGGQGGPGGGGSGVYLQSPDERYPWIIVAPGGGGGGGGGLSSFAGVGGAGVSGPSDAALGEGSAETRGVPRAQCVAGVNAFAIHGGGPAGQEAQRGDAGRDAGAAQTSTGGQGGAGGGCFGGAAGAEGPDSFSGGAGGAGGVGFSLYPESTTDLGTLGTGTSHVTIEWFGDNPTSAAPITESTPTLRALAGSPVELTVPFVGIGAAPVAPAGIPEGLQWTCEAGAAVPSCVISGTAATGTAGEHPLVIVAEGGTRSVTLVVEEPPAFGATVPSELTWATSAVQRVDLPTTGDPTRVVGLRGSVPSWLSLAEGAAVGVSVLEGTPPTGAEGTYDLQLVLAQDVRTLSASLSPAWVVRDLTLTVVGDGTPSGPPVVVDPPPPTDPSDPDPPPGSGDPTNPEGPDHSDDPTGQDDPADPTSPASPSAPVPSGGTSGPTTETPSGGTVDEATPTRESAPFALSTGVVWPIGVGLVILLLIAAGFAVRAWLLRRR